MKGFFNFLTLFLFIYRTNAKFNNRFYPRVHLAPPKNQWMNDPNGWSYFQGIYHIFYQNNPYSSLGPGIANWGHATSPDLVHWKHKPIALSPNNTYDRNGVFSGSALIDDDVMYLYYTGRINHPGKIPNHEEHQALAISTDGVTFKKYENNPIILGEEYQPDFRDPKVWKHGDHYYMVIGNSFQNEKNDSLGRVLLYKSSDKYNWTQECVIDESDGRLGYMWECPDFFELDGRFVFLFSPQGVKADGYKYNNLYQCGYKTGTFNYDTCKFEDVTEFQELDHGHDFYATQTILTPSGKRAVIAWLDMWNQTYPERADGFAGTLSLVRFLSLSSDNRLIQKPINMASARANMIRKGHAYGGTQVTFDDKAGEVNIRANVADFELYIESENVSVKISYDVNNSTMSVDRGGVDGVRRTIWSPKGVLILNIYIDASSIELFCGIGEAVFSTRFFPPGCVSARLGDTSNVEQMRVYNYKRTVDIY